MKESSAENGGLIQKAREMNQYYFSTHLRLFVHVPGEGNSIICNLFDVSNRIKALLVISCNIEKEKGFKKVRVTKVICTELSLSNGENLNFAYSSS